MMWMLKSKKVSLSSTVSDITGVKFGNNLVTQTATIRDCMSHSTGIQAQAGRDMITHGYSREQAYETLKCYDNTGYKLLFQYTDVVYTLGFNAGSLLLDETIIDMLTKFLKRANMNDSSVDARKYKNDHRIVPQYNPQGLVSKYNHVAVECPPAAGFAVTIGDLNKYIKLHIDQVSWIPDIKEMYKPVVAKDTSGKYYGIGTNIFEVLGNRVYSHAGAFTSGVSSYVMYDIHNKIGIGIISNSLNPVPETLSRYIYYILRGESCESAYKESLRVESKTIKLLQDSTCTSTVPTNKKKDTSRFDGIYKSDRLGTLIIKDGMIRVGKTNPVKLYYDGNELGWTTLDINNNVNPAIGKVIYKCNNVAGLTTFIGCDYYTYTKK